MEIPPDTPPPIAELHCVSNFTFLRGASHPAELVDRAAELGYAALAITDECSVAGVVRAHVRVRERRDAGLPVPHLILGTELALGDDFRLVALVRDEAGWRKRLRADHGGPSRGRQGSLLARRDAARERRPRRLHAAPRPALPAVAARGAGAAFLVGPRARPGRPPRARAAPRPLRHEAAPLAPRRLASPRPAARRGQRRAPARPSPARPAGCPDLRAPRLHARRRRATAPSERRAAPPEPGDAARALPRRRARERRSHRRRVHVLARLPELPLPARARARQCVAKRAPSPPDARRRARALARRRAGTRSPG